MIVGDSIDWAKICEVVFVGSIIAVPGNHIEGRELLSCCEEVATEFGSHFVADLSVLKGCNWGLKVARIGQPISSCSDSHVALATQKQTWFEALIALAIPHLFPA